MQLRKLRFALLIVLCPRLLLHISNKIGVAMTHGLVFTAEIIQLVAM